MPNAYSYPYGVNRVDQTKRTGAGTPDNPLTEIQIQDLLKLGISEGDTFAGKGTLTPYGTWDNSGSTGTSLGSGGAGSSGGTGTGSTGSFYSPNPDPYGSTDVENYLRETANTPVNEDDIYRRMLRLYQKEIDATNQMYDQMVNTARIEGEGRLGSQAAMGARAGILGSDFANAQEQKVRGYNSDIVHGIQAERSARINSIMGFARKSAADEIAAKNLARRQGAESYLKYLAGKTERKSENMNKLAGALLAQGIDPSELDEKQLNEIATQFDTTKDEIISSYAIYKASQSSGDQFTLGPGESRFDSSGNLLASVDPSQEGKVYSTSSGLVRVMPDGSTQLIYGTGDGASKGFTSGSLTISGEQMSQISQNLEGTRGGDGYVNTEAYVSLYKQFTGQGGLPKDFFAKFPPKDYLNPNDETIPDAMKGKLKSSDDPLGLFG